MLTPDLIKSEADLRHLNWSRIRYSSGTAGSYLKARDSYRGKKIYYKLSCFDSVNGISGHECVNELIVDRLLTILGIEHLHYQLIHARITVDEREYSTYLCASEDFKEFGDSKISLEHYYELEHDPGESVLEFCERMGWSEYIYTMLLVDFLILNRDRHGANIEILKNARTGQIRPAPLFDHGLSLLFSCRTENEARNYDSLADKRVNNYIGSRSSRDNLSLIPAEMKPLIRRLEQRDKATLFSGLDNILPDVFFEKIWDMIWNRWCYYENM